MWPWTPSAESCGSGNGVVISGLPDMAVDFIEYDGTYRGYDAVVAGPWDLSEADLHVANRMVARIGTVSGLPCVAGATRSAKP